MSAMVTSGVASFSTNRASRGSQRDRQVVALPGHARAAGAAQRRQRIVVDLAARHDRDLVVEQIDQAAQDAALGLAAQSEQDEVVPREDGVDELRDDRLVVADDAREQLLARLQLADQVVADLLLDRNASRIHAAAEVRPGFESGPP